MHALHTVEAHESDVDIWCPVQCLTHLPTCTYLAFLCLFEQVVVFYTPLFPQFSLSEQLRDNDMKTSPTAVHIHQNLCRWTDGYEVKNIIISRLVVFHKIIWDFIDHVSKKFPDSWNSIQWDITWLKFLLLNWSAPATVLIYPTQHKIKIRWMFNFVVQQMALAYKPLHALKLV